MDLTPPPSTKRQRANDSQAVSKRQRLDESPQHSQGNAPEQNEAGRGLSMKIFADIAAFVTEPDSAKEQAERMQGVIRKIALIASNVYSQGKSCDEVFSSDAVALLQEAASMPLHQKVKKPKKPKNADPKPNEKAKPVLQEQDDIPTPTPRRSTREHSKVDEESEPEGQEFSTSIVKQAELRVTPSRQGDQWKATWTTISKDLTEATKTKIGDVMDRIFSYQGVNDALDMAKQVIDNHEVMEIDAASISIIKLSSVDSPARHAAVRCKLMWDQALPKDVRGVRLLNNYRLLAQEIQTLEQQAMSSETPFGKLFDANRSEVRRRRRTPETTSAFVLDHLVEIMFQEGNEEQRKARHRRLTKDRDIARNVDSIVNVFGIGIIPLMCKASWQSAFSQVSPKTMAPVFLRLKEEEPALFAVTESVRESFFQFVQDRRALQNLPDEPMRGMTMRKEKREQLTMLELVLPKPVKNVAPNVFRPARMIDRFLQKPAEEEASFEDMAGGVATEGVSEEGQIVGEDEMAGFSIFE